MEIVLSLLLRLLHIADRGIRPIPTGNTPAYVAVVDQKLNATMAEFDAWNVGFMPYKGKTTLSFAAYCAEWPT